MASLAIGTAGAFIGNAIFPGLGGALGWAFGAAVGNYFFGEKPAPNRLHDLHLQGSSYGAFIKIIYGTVRISGNVIWETDLQEHISGGKGGKDSGGQASYTASFDVALCETQVLQIYRIWAGGRLNYDFNQSGGEDIPFVLYDGDASQEPDPTEEAVEGAGNVPAYRGISRVVFTDWDMTQFGNSIPQLSFEVVTSQGDIPWRVSSFDNYPHSAHQMGASYADGVITVGDYPAGDFIGPYYENYYYLDGTSAGAETSHGVIGGMSGTICNKQIAVYYDSDTGFTSWYINGVISTRIQGNPVGGNTYQTCYGIGIFQNEFLFVPCWNSSNANIGVARFPAPDGIPEGLHDLSYVVGVGGGMVVDSQFLGFGTGDNGCIYVTLPNSGGLGDVEMFEFDEELNLLRHWDNEDGSGPFVPRYIQPGVPFVVYNGYIACENHADAAGDKFTVLSMNDDNTFTKIGQIPLTLGFYAVRVQGGLCVTRDGVVSLDPPIVDTTLAQVVGDLCDKAGITSYDVSELESIIVDGYVIEAQTSCRAAIETLMPVYFFDAVESDGVVKFVVRGGPSIVTFEEDDLAAHMDSEGLPSLLTCVHTPDVDLPSGLAIAYMNKDGDYQVNTQVSQRMVGGSRDLRTVSIPVVLTDSHAKRIVDSWLYNAWSERDAYTWYSSRKYAAYEPTDVVTVQGKVLRVTKKLEGATGVIRWDGVLSRGANFVQSGSGAGSANSPGQILPVSQNSQLVLLDIPLLEDDDSPNGIYAAMAGTVSPSYAGGGLFKSLDGTNYTRIAIAPRANTIGTATTALPNYTGPNIIDAGSVVRVTIGAGGGTLTGTTLTGIMNGENEGILGTEIFQWMTADLVSAGVYDLSGLLRGRRGTEWAQSSHIVGERFVAFSPVLLNPPAPFAEIGSTEYYKPVTAGRSLANATAQTFANIANALKPYSPANLGGGCDASGNVTLNWLRRTRIGGGGRLVGPKPLSETTEAYVVQIWDASYSLCARIIQVTTETASYTAAQQVTDFGALQQTIFWTVGQIGAVSIGAQSRGTAPSTGGSNVAPLVPIVPYSFNPIVSPPPPPGGGAAPDGTLTWPADSKVIPMTIGQRKVYSFTTGASIPMTGTIAVSEYGTTSPPTPRRCFITTDSDGLNMVAHSLSQGGTTATSYIGASLGGAVLAAATTYYYVFDFVMADGSLSGVAGTNAQTILNLGNVT